MSALVELIERFERGEITSQDRALIVKLLRVVRDLVESSSRQVSDADARELSQKQSVVSASTASTEALEYEDWAERLWGSERPSVCPHCGGSVVSSACSACQRPMRCRFVSAEDWARQAIGSVRVEELCREYEERYPGVRWMSTPRWWRTPGGLVLPVNPYSPHLLALEDVILRCREYDQHVERLAGDVVTDIGRKAEEFFSSQFRGRDDEHTAYEIARFVWASVHRGRTLPGKRKSDAWRSLAELVAEYGIGYVASVLETFFSIREWGDRDEVVDIERFGYPVRIVTGNFGRWELLHERRVSRRVRELPPDPLVEYRRLLDAAWVAHVGAYARIVGTGDEAPWEGEV